MNMVCLCGSARFVKDFDDANRELTARGLSILTIAMALPKVFSDDGVEQESPLKVILDLVHLNKVLRADAVLVVGDGYIGRSTAREIMWTRMQGKPLYSQTWYAAEEPTDWDRLFYSMVSGEQRMDVQILTFKARHVLGLT